jgi:diphthine-ammonia ligase
MKLGVLFSGGKDSTYAALLARKGGHDLTCLISIFSKNPDSFMFHTPAIELTKKQAKSMGVPIIIKKTEGKKEDELRDLIYVIKKAIQEYRIEGIVTGAVESVYQASRVQKICNGLNIACFNPLWQKNQLTLLHELIENNFEVIISSVAAYPLDKSWIGRKIDSRFLLEVEILQKNYKINPAGEGGEFESLVLNCPLFTHRVLVKKIDLLGHGNSWRGIFE